MDSCNVNKNLVPGTVILPVRSSKGRLERVSLTMAMRGAGPSAVLAAVLAGFAAGMLIALAVVESPRHARTELDGAYLVSKADMQRCGFVFVLCLGIRSTSRSDLSSVCQ